MLDGDTMTVDEFDEMFLNMGEAKTENLRE